MKYVALGLTVLVVAAVLVGCGAKKAGTAKSNAYGKAIPADMAVTTAKEILTNAQAWEGKDVLVVEGICASGRTLAYLLRNFQTRNPASIRVCALLAKQCPRSQELTLHYVGREIPDVFVVGYGLDRDERFRNLPHIARLA